jgi:predicted  nucleic acid-binding Zn-ribbon protein
MPRCFPIQILRRLFLAAALVALSGCAGAYYSAMEKAGIHKRDILVDRVEAARDAQTDAQTRFQSALDQFSAVVDIGASDLKTAYERLNTEFQSAEAAAQQVADRIDKVEAVAGALFDEWEQELDLYRSENLRRASRAKFEDTRRRYADMLAAMRRAEQRMAPVLDSFRDNVLFLKHNLNAQAIGALKGEVSTLKREIDDLIRQMNEAIASSEQFIARMRA